MPYPRDSIREEYDDAAHSAQEHDRVKWGSRASMLNRFSLVMRSLDFSSSARWLDVGCGTGALQAMVLQRFPHISATAIDLSPELVAQASTRADAQGARFLVEDYLDHQPDAPYDLLTCVGVLQKTNISPEAFFAKAARLLAPGGRLFLDTKSPGRVLVRGGFIPETSIEWFAARRLVASARANGFTVERFLGFRPDTGRAVPPACAHTVFLIAARSPQ